MDPTDSDAVRERLQDTMRDRLHRLDVFRQLGSTNTFLMEQAAPPPGRFSVVLAGRQTEGRGRMGKHWHSPPGVGLYLSLAYTFLHMPGHAASLTLVTGIGVSAALQALGAHDVQLKWPNDLILRDGKLGGILTETKSLPGERMTAVIGIGINVDIGAMSGEAGASVGRVANLVETLDDLPPIAELAAVTMQHVAGAVQSFDAEGFAGFHSQWQALDWLAGKSVGVTTPADEITGVAQGIDLDGALLLQSAGELKRIVSGSVTLQPGRITRP